MGTEKVEVRDALQLRIREAAAEVASTEPGASKVGPVPKGSSVLHGSGPWYVYVNLEPQRFYAVPDLQLAMRLRRQKGWHVVTTSGVVWRIKRLKGAMKAPLDRDTFLGRVRELVVDQLVTSEQLYTTPSATIETWIRRLGLIAINEDTSQPIDPRDIRILAEAFGVEVTSLYVRADNTPPVPWVIDCDAPEYPWERAVVFAPSEADAAAWIKAQWIFEYFEGLCAGKTVRQRIKEYDMVLKATISALPAWVPGRVVALDACRSFQDAMQIAHTLADGDGTGSLLKEKDRG